jgi:aspartate aminotransferase
MAGPALDVFRYAHEHRREIAWLSQNTNHLVPPEAVQPAILEAVRERLYEGYPLASGQIGLRERVLTDLGLPPETGFLVSAGATEALYMLTRALLGPGDRVVASDPSYLIIHRFVGLSGAVVDALDIYQPPYRLAADRVQAAITDRTRMILLIDPLNPLGSGYPPDEVRAIAEIARDHRLLLVNDVTYRDFAERHTLATTVYPERSLTVWSAAKNCGLAGLRIGGLAGPADLVKEVLKYNTNDLGVNVLAQAAATAALASKPKWIDRVRTQTRENQARIRAVVQKLPDVFLPVYPSQGNMFAIDLSGAHVPPEAMQQELLLGHGVFVRAGNYLSPRFGDRFIRVSFSNPPADIDRFLAAFPVALAKLRNGAPPVSVSAARLATGRS